MITFIVMMTSSNGNIFRVASHSAGNSPVPGESPTNGWVNNREAGDLRRYRAHYDVIVKFQVARDYSPIPQFQTHRITMVGSVDVDIDWAWS